MEKYSETDHYTVKELRNFNFPVPNHLPDNAYIKKSGVEQKTKTKSDTGISREGKIQAGMSVSVDIHFTEKFIVPEGNNEGKNGDEDDTS